MEITVKNIKEFEGRNGFGLNATLYVNNVKTAEIFDEGNGGEMVYTSLNDGLLDQAKQFASQLPSNYTFYDGAPMPMDLDMFVNEYIDNNR